MPKPSKKISTLIKKVEQIPTLPAISQKVLEITQDESASIHEIAKLIEADQALAAKLLKVANSSFYSSLNTVSSIDHAVVMLGITEVKSVLLGFSVHNFFSQHEGTLCDQKRFWHHAIICSQIAKLLGRKFNVRHDETLFLVGLIHDIGKVVLDQYLYEDFEQIIEYVSANNSTFSKAEKEILGTTHYQIAAKLLRQWQFPDTVTMPVLYHHAPWYDKEYETSSIIIYLANILTHLVGFSCSPDEEKVNLSNFTQSPEFAFILKNGIDLDYETMMNLINQIKQTIITEADNVIRLFE